MGDIVLNNGTTITAEELAEIAGEVKKLIAKEAKEPSQYEEVNSLANLTTLPALLQNGAVYQLVRAKVELLKGKDAKELEMRLSETAIQWCRDGDEVWQDLITIDKIQEPAKATIAAAEKATEDAIAAETERKSGWQAWFENATTGVKAIWSKWFGDTKTDWTAFDTAASQAESERELEEQVRLSAENIRNSAENERQSAETARASAETTRQSQESARANAETARQSEEAVRQSNESSRETAEEGRVNAESARANAETARQSAWAAWFEHATTGVKAIWNSWFGTTKSDWNSFNTAANQAESSRATEYASLREDIVAKTEAADEAAAYANEMADHTPIIGEDGYWYRWDSVNDVYVRTDDYAKGGADYPVFGLDVETMNVTVDAAISNDRYAVTDDGVLVVLF